MTHYPPGPSPKGIWNKQRNPKHLSERAKSSRQHIKMRTKGQSKYPGGRNLCDPKS